MHPTVGKVDFHAVDIGDSLVLILLFDSGKDGVDIDVGRKLNLVFGNAVLRIFLLELANGFALFSEQGQEKSHADESVATVDRALCKITGVSAGECDIIVTAFDGSTRTIHVTVR